MHNAMDLAGWVAMLSRADLPVLRHTARKLEDLRADEDRLNARSIAHLVVSDPMMTVKLLRYMQEHKRLSQLQELVDVEQTILMMGLEPFFREVAPAPLVEDLLRDQRDALLHLLYSVRRSQRASHYAFDWALMLHDLHAEEARVAALLGNLSEQLMWCFNPQAMLHKHALQQADPTLRSADAQVRVLGFRGLDMQHALATEWHLPGLLLTLMDPAQADNERVRSVMLALRLARHSAQGWDDPALADDYREIADLLRMEEEQVVAMVGAKPEDPGLAP